jgi:hypothetical protein
MTYRDKLIADGQQELVEWIDKENGNITDDGAYQEHYELRHDDVFNAVIAGGRELAQQIWDSQN